MPDSYKRRKGPDVTQYMVRGDPFITFAERGRGGVEKFDQNANAVREVA